MLASSTGLTPVVLDAVAALEQRTVAADGGRLKLEWGVLRDPSAGRVDDVLWWDGDRLLGFLGVYAFGGVDVELAGMVDPVARRRGIGTALLGAALPLVAQRGATSALLVCPRAGGGGADFARARGGTPDHSEHALVLPGEPAAGPSDPAVTLRPATPADGDRIAQLLLEGFGYAPRELVDSADELHEQNLVVVRDGAVVGYLRTSLHDGTGGVYGFVIDAAVRGRGIGRDVLRRTCQALRASGARQVGLEVEVDNERALGLYTSLGFEPVITEDYFRIAVPGQ